MILRLNAAMSGGPTSLRRADTSSVAKAPRFNESAAGVVLLCPLTTTERSGIPWHIEIGENGGLPQRSFVMCEQVRSASEQRLSERIGVVPSAVLEQVEDRLRVLMAL